MADKETKIPGLLIGNIEKHQAGTTVEVVNQPFECPTLLVEGINGIAISAHLVKVHFIEQFPSEGRIQGRNVITLAIPKAEAVKIFKLLGTLVDQIEEIPPEDFE